MSNTGQFYDHTTYPVTGAAGSSAALRAELDAIEAGFNKLPSLSGNAGKLVRVSTAGTDLDVSTVISDDGTNASIAGGLVVSGALGRNAGQLHTIPAVTADVYALLAATQTLTNKTVNLASNTLTGTLAQFNTALSDADFASTATAQTLTNKTIDLASNTLTGTLAQFNAALSGADFASLAGAETLTNKTLTSPVISGGSVNNTPIGAGTPNTGSFTTLVTSGLATLASVISSGSSAFTSTDFLGIPSGTTAQRGSPSRPSIRYNETLSRFEGWASSVWGAIGGGATGGGSDTIFYLNGQTVTQNYTVPAGQNAGSFGPITIADGVTVTLADGATWTIV